MLRCATPSQYSDTFWISVSLIVQIHLQQNRADLALKEVQAAKRWAQDSLLVNLAESWVGLRVVRDRKQNRLKAILLQC